MVTTIISRFLGKLKKEATTTIPSPTSENKERKETPNNGIDNSKINIIAFVDFVLRSMVDHPDEVTIDTQTDDGGLVIKVSCNKDEIRKIIGKNGKTINAIRALAKGAAKRVGQSVTIVVVD